MRKPKDLSLIGPQVIEYPESDGQPMGETQWHVFLLARTLLALEAWLRPRRDVHVGGNQFVYFEEGDPTEVVCPDVFVAFGVEPGSRPTWKTWEEGGLFPQLIIELLSKSTRRRDLGAKRGAYESLGVEEYFAFEPLARDRTPRLLGWRRSGHGVFVPIEPERGVGALVLRSEKLGLLLEEDGDDLRFVDPSTGERLRDLHEHEVRQAEAEERWRVEAEGRRVEAEGRRVEAEGRRAEAEARRRAEAEVERLRAELERRRGG